MTAFLVSLVIRPLCQGKPFALSAQCILGTEACVVN